MEKNTSHNNNRTLRALYYCKSRPINWKDPGGVISAKEAQRFHDTRGVYGGFFQPGADLAYFIEAGRDVMVIVILDKKLRQIGDASFVEDVAGCMHLSSLYEWNYSDENTNAPSHPIYWHIRKDGTRMVSKSTNVQELWGAGNHVFGPVKDFAAKRPAFGEYDDLLNLYFEARKDFHSRDSAITG